MLFNQAEAAKIERLEGTPLAGRYEVARGNYQQAHQQRQQVARNLIQNRHSDTNLPGTNPDAGPQQLKEANQAVEDARQEGIQLLREVNSGSDYNDTNYIFLNFVTSYFPLGSWDSSLRPSLPPQCPASPRN